MQKIKILHLEDVFSDAELVERELKKAGMLYEKIVVDNKVDFIKELKEFSPDVILSDHSLHAFNSIQAFEIVKDANIKVPFILVTATVSEEFAVDIIKQGATDYVLKDRLQRLPTAILQAMKQQAVEGEREKFFDELVKRNRDLEQFAYIVSHNLRAPVANIRGFFDALISLELDEETKKKIMQHLTISVKKLDEIIVDLNQILQIKSGENEPKTIIEFSNVVDDIKSTITNVIEKEQVKIETDFSEAKKIFTLKSYLYNIFYNLIMNSIKYRQSLIPPVIKIKSLKEKNIIRLIFEDNGLGIDLAKNYDQVFGLYKRFHRHVEGKGMGLFMVKTEVEILGGSIDIKSTVNKGTAFTIDFIQPQFFIG